MNRQLSKNVVIVNELGMHARSAAKIAHLVKLAKAAVWLERDGERADATSVIDLLSLGCPQGATVSVVISDSADMHILEAVVELIENGFGE